DRGSGDSRSVRRPPSSPKTDWVSGSKRSPPGTSGNARAAPIGRRRTRRRCRRGCASRTLRLVASVALNRDAAPVERRPQIVGRVLADRGHDVWTLEELGALFRSRPAAYVRILEDLVERPPFAVLA